MTPIERFLKSLLVLDVWVLVKWLLLLGLGMYFVFALVMIRQIELMSGTLDGELNLPLRLIGWLHMMVAVGLFLVALVVL